MVETAESPRVLLVDFAPPKISRAMIMGEAPDYSQILPPGLEDAYMDREELGDISDPASWYRIYSQNPKATMMYGVIDLLKPHASFVAGTMTKVWRDAGFESERPYLIPTQSVTERNLDFRMDNPDRPTLFITIEPEPVIEAVTAARREFPDLCVLDLSLQMGPLGYQYEIDDEVRNGRKATDPTIIYAYGKDNAMQNVPKLFPICDAFPDMLVVTPAGNGRDDLREVRARYQDSWPKGLLVGGAWHGEEARNNGVEGADVYTEQYTHGHSSLAAAALAALGRMLGRLEVPPEDKLARIMELADSVSVAGGEVHRLLDVANAARVFMKI